MPRIGNTVSRRAVVLCILLLLQGSLLEVAGQAGNQCPNPACVATDYERFVGTDFRLHGSIVDTDPARMRVTTSRGSYTLTLTGLVRTPQSGTRIVVYGTLKPNHTMAVAEFVTHPRGGRARTYRLGIVGALLVVGLTVRYWKVDTETLAVRSRGER